MRLNEDLTCIKDRKAKEEGHDENKGTESRNRVEKILVGK